MRKVWWNDRVALGTVVYSNHIGKDLAIDLHASILLGARPFAFAMCLFRSLAPNHLGEG